MRVLICEYVTSGGWRDRPLPEALLPGGLLIRDALLADLEDLPGVRPILTYDDRLPRPSAEALPVRRGEDPWITWSGLAQDVDVIWPVAPETGGILTRMLRVMRESGARVVGPTPDVSATVSSKLETAKRLAAAGIRHVPTFPLDSAPASLNGDIVTKPDVGAASENVRAWPNRAAILRSGAGLVVQPFVAGTPVSLTTLVRPDGVTLLSVNKLEVTHLVGVFTVRGVTVGAIRDADGALASLAQKVVEAFPGLAGLVDIEAILTPEGPVVVEIHARATFAYGGLRAALGINPAAFLPELIREGRPPALPHLPQPSPVHVKIR